MYFGFTFIEMLHLIDGSKNSDPKIILRSKGTTFHLSMEWSQIHDQPDRESSYMLIEMMAQQLDGRFEITEGESGKSTKFSFVLKEGNNG